MYTDECILLDYRLSSSFGYLPGRPASTNDGYTFPALCVLTLEEFRDSFLLDTVEDSEYNPF